MRVQNFENMSIVRQNFVKKLCKTTIAWLNPYDITFHYNKSEKNGDYYYGEDLILYNFNLKGPYVDAFRDKKGNLNFKNTYNCNFE